MSRKKEWESIAAGWEKLGRVNPKPFKRGALAALVGTGLVLGVLGWRGAL
jgi:hypothetical protein